MTKTSIKKLLQRAAGGAEFVTKGDIKKALGCGNDRAAEVTKDLSFIRFGRTQHYDVDEVAQRLFENMVRMTL